jgi:hypothetical protein
MVRAAGGNPLALTELPSMLTPGQLAGPQPAARPLPIAEGLERAFLASLGARAPEVRTLALLCAAEASGETATIERAASALGISDLAAGLVDLADVVRLEGPAVARDSADRDQQAGAAGRRGATSGARTRIAPPTAARVR